jgi:hypothetical protein
LYDPITGGFTVAGAMTSARDAHTATRLADGTVLLAGGIDGVSVSATAEIFDPATSSFRATGSMSAGRVFHTSVLLPNGKVLIAGGFNGSYLSSAELYDPSTGLFSETFPMNAARSGHTCALLSDGTVLITGGMNSSGYLNSAEIFDPIERRFRLTNGIMTTARAWHTASMVSDSTDHTKDRVLVAGGTDGSTILASAELYDPSSQQFSKTSGDMPTARQKHTAVTLKGGDQGYLRVNSKIGLLFTEFYDNEGADAALNGINMAAYAGVTRIYSPRFSIRSDYQTFINLINGNQNSAANVTLTLHAADGSVLSTPVNWLLPKNGQIKGNLWTIFQNDPVLLNQTGWLEVSSDVDFVVGVISFTNSSNSFLASFELSGTPMRNFLFPLVSEDSVYTTEVSLLNSGDLPATAQIELRGLSGTLDGTATVTLPPHTGGIDSLSSLFPGMLPHRTANIRIRSDQPIHSFSILSDRQLRFISSVPPVVVPGS